MKAAVAEAKVAAPSKAAAKSQPPPADDAKGFPDAKMAEAESVGGAERGKSRGGTRGGKPNKATADTGLSGFGGVPAPNLDSEIEKCDGSEATTQALLGELITKPKLSEKLLQKPPFRFLHDIVMEVMKATGFATDLYVPDEMDSAKVADKTQKMTFLEKIIKLVGIQLNTLVEARPARIVAGLDAQITNNFLQLLAVAAKHVPDSTNAVRTVIDQMNGATGGGGDQEASAPSPAPAPAQERGRQPEEKKAEERPKPQRQVRDVVQCRSIRDYTSIRY